MSIQQASTPAPPNSSLAFISSHQKLHESSCLSMLHLLCEMLALQLSQHVQSLSSQQEREQVLTHCFLTEAVRTALLSGPGSVVSFPCQACQAPTSDKSSALLLEVRSLGNQGTLAWYIVHAYKAG